MTKNRRKKSTDLAPSSSDPRSTSIFALALLLVAGLLVAYAPALRGEFLWDDDMHVTAPSLRGLDGLGKIWTEPRATQQYYPLLHSMFWIEHRLWGDSTLGYHLVNLSLHALSALLLLVLLRHLGAHFATLAAFLFAFHPVAVESVAWISEQKNTLSTALYLGSALLYLRFREQKKARTYVLATALFIAALLSKSVTATLPAALLVLLWWKGEDFDWRREIRPLLPWFGLSAAMSVVTVLVERHIVGASGSDWALSTTERILVFGRAVWFYALKLVWPKGLTFVYPRWELDSASPGQWLFPLALVLAAISLWVLRNRSRGVVAGILIYVGSLFPALGIFDVYPFRYSFVADHFQYLASLAGLATLAAIFHSSVAKLPKTAAQMIGAAIVLFCATLTHNYASEYRTAIGHYEGILEKNPACWMAFNNLGALRMNSDPDEAEKLFERGLVLAPNYAELHTNLGDARVRLRKDREAEDPYRRALELDPRSVHVLTNLGNLLRRSGRGAESRGLFERAVEIDPSNAKAQANLGIALTQANLTADGLQRLRTAASLAPADAEVWAALARSAERAGSAEEAVSAYEESLRLDPGSSTVENNFGEMLLRRDQLSLAEQHLQRAVALDGANAQALNNLGVLRIQQGRELDALKAFEAALSADPGYVSARNNLARLRREIVSRPSIPPK